MLLFQTKPRMFNILYYVSVQISCVDETAKAIAPDIPTKVQCSGLDVEYKNKDVPNAVSVFKVCLDVMSEEAITEYLTSCNHDSSKMEFNDRKEQRKPACAIFEAFIYDCKNSNYGVRTVDWRDEMNCGEFVNQ